MSGASATAQARKGRYACTHVRLLDDWRGGPYCNSDHFSFSTLSLGPLETKVHVFLDGLSENDRKGQNERVHEFCSSGLVFAGTAVFLFGHQKGSQGAYPDRFYEL